MLNRTLANIANVVYVVHEFEKHLVEFVQQDNASSHPNLAITHERWESVQPGLDVLQMDVGADAVWDVFQEMVFVIQCSDTSTTRELLKIRSETIGTCVCDVWHFLYFPVSVICSAVFAVGLF